MTDFEKEVLYFVDTLDTILKNGTQKNASHKKLFNKFSIVNINCAPKIVEGN